MDKKIDWEHIHLAKERMAANKAEIRRLTEENKEINRWLDSELVVSRNDRLLQRFEAPDGTIIKATVPQNFTLNQDAFEVLMNNCPELQQYSDAFAWKASVKEGAWWKLPAEVQAMFASVVTINAGLTRWEFEAPEG